LDRASKAWVMRASAGAGLIVQQLLDDCRRRFSVHSRCAGRPHPILPQA
jgi:hypothetical protein